MTRTERYSIYAMMILAVIFILIMRPEECPPCPCPEAEPPYTFSFTEADQIWTQPISLEEDFYVFWDSAQLPIYVFDSTINHGIFWESFYHDNVWYTDEEGDDFKMYEYDPTINWGKMINKQGDTVEIKF